MHRQHLAIKLLWITTIGLAFANLSLGGCRPGVFPSSTVGGGSPTSGPPRLIHVSNGTTTAFYSSSGAYGFGTQANSVFSTIQGATAQMAQNSNTGNFLLGSNASNAVIYMNGRSGGFLFSTLVASGVLVNTSGVAEGVVVDSTRNIFYVLDSFNKKVSFLSGVSASFYFGSLASSTFNLNGFFPVPLSVKYLGLDENQGRLFITDPSSGIVYTMKTSDQTQVGTGLELYGLAACTSLKYLVVDSSQSKAFVLCNGATASLVIISTDSTPPSFALGSQVNSTIATTIATGTDVAVMNGKSSVLVTGGSAVALYSSVSGALVTSLDLSGSCTAAGIVGLSLSSIVYGDTADTIYVSDSANSRIYSLLFSSGILSFKNGTCSNSNFSTVSDVSSPTRISFY